ncbi:hypothetical protein BU15DRAFT_79772 [Melanogaster broomeanus]|nr:hypothetical protein BU15DRAFT_79772 [Melanogaster broomeanus]
MDSTTSDRLLTAARYTKPGLPNPSSPTDFYTLEVICLAWLLCEALDPAAGRLSDSTAAHAPALSAGPPLEARKARSMFPTTVITVYNVKRFLQEAVFEPSSTRRERAVAAGDRAEDVLHIDRRRDPPLPKQPRQYPNQRKAPSEPIIALTVTTPFVVNTMMDGINVPTALTCGWA